MTGSLDIVAMRGESVVEKKKMVDGEKVVEFRNAGLRFKSMRGSRSPS